MDYDMDIFAKIGAVMAFGVDLDIIRAVLKVREGKPLGNLKLTRQLVNEGYIIELPERTLTDKALKLLARWDEWEAGK